jgi:general secretion pathway protein K
VRRTGEQGMALITVLLLVAVMGALTASALETISHSMRIAGNSRTGMQARYHALGAEALALARLEALVTASGSKLTLAGGWHGQAFPLPAPDAAAVTARVTDGGNCFNLNSVVDGGDAARLVARPRGITQLTALMTSLGIPEASARQTAFALADWIDADGAPLPLGGEDESYAAAPVRYRTGNTLLAERSELRAVAGVTAETYEIIRPWVCALPTTEMSPINVNTLAPAQAPLLAMLLPGRLGMDAARQVLAGRPAEGWDDGVIFWQQPQLIQLLPSSEELEQAKFTTRYFNLEIDVEQDGYTLTQTALLDVVRGKSRVVQRRWTVDE